MIKRTRPLLIKKKKENYSKKLKQKYQRNAENWHSKRHRLKMYAKEVKPTLVQRMNV